MIRNLDGTANFPQLIAEHALVDEVVFHDENVVLSLLGRSSARLERKRRDRMLYRLSFGTHRNIRGGSV